MRRALLALVLAAAAVAAVFAIHHFGGGASGGNGGTGGTGGAENRGGYAGSNVLLITLDTVRLDRMSAYGAARQTTPNLEKLAAQSVKFDACYAQSSFTPPSHASILTSRYVSSHGVKWWNYKLDDKVITLAEVFQLHGFATACFTPLKLATTNNLKQGFDGVFELTSVERNASSPEVTIAPGSVVRERFEGWLKNHTGSFFAWVHFYDAHRPYSANSPERVFCASKTARFGNQMTRDYQLKPSDREARGIGKAEANALIDRYDSGLYGLDHEIGVLLDHLRAEGVLEHTFVVITADHGEAFDEFDEEWFTHDPFLADCVTHVPLIVRFPDRKFSGTKVEPIAESIDIGPTLLDYCELPLAPGMQGVSLRPAIETGRPVKSFAFSETQGRDQDSREPNKVFTPEEIHLVRSLRGAHERLIVDGENGPFHLFDRTREPFESNDMIDSDAAHAQPMRAAFAGMMKVVRSLTPSANVSELTPDQVKFMLEQGYTGGDSGPTSAPATNPASAPHEPRKPGDDG